MTLIIEVIPLKTVENVNISDIKTTERLIETKRNIMKQNEKSAL